MPDSVEQNLQFPMPPFPGTNTCISLPSLTFRLSLPGPPFRAILPAVHKDLASTDPSSDYLMVYIEEAHATDEWPISSSRYNPSGEPVSVAQPRTVIERTAVAKTFMRTFGLEGEGGAMSVAVDSPEEGNPFSVAYAPW